MTRTVDSSLYNTLGLLYEKNYLSSQLTSDPSRGELDVSAFLDGKERCFRALDKTKIQSKKTIILSTWYFQYIRNHSNLAYMRIMQLFGTLKMQGFTIYVPNEKKLIKINDEASLIAEMRHYTPLTTQSTQLMAAQLQLSSEQIDIIDLQRLRELLQGLSQHHVSPYAEEIDPSLFESPPPIPVTGDRKQSHIQEALIEPEDQFRFSGGEIEYQSLSKKIKRHIYQLSFSTPEWDEGAYLRHDAHETPHLKSVNLAHLNLKSEDLETFFRKNKPLEKMCLLFCKHPVPSPLTLSPNLLEDLVNLRITECHFTTETLLSLIKTAPNLESIDIDMRSIKPATPLLFTTDCLRHLASLTVRDINTTQLSAFLKSTPNLKTLDIHEHDDLNGLALNLQPVSLNQLTELQLYDTSINQNQLAEIILAAPHLEKITLFRCMGIEKGDLNLGPKQWLQLKTLSVIASSLYSNQLLNLIHAAPNLEELDVSSCAHLSETFMQLKPGDLKHIKIIKIPLTTTLAELSTLFKATPQIEIIDLAGHENLGSAQWSFKPNELTQVYQLDVSGTPIKAKSLSNILLATPKLIHLNLSHCREFSDSPLTLKPDQLLHLKTLNLERSHITGPQLASFINAAPHLETLDISHCKHLGVKALQLTSKPLHHLKTIHVGYPYITALQLATLIKKAPHLESLFIDNVELNRDQIQALFYLSQARLLDLLEHYLFEIKKAAHERLYPIESTAKNTQGLTKASAVQTSSPIGLQKEHVIDGQLKNDPTKTIQVHQWFKGHLTTPKTNSYHIHSSLWVQPGVFANYKPSDEDLEEIHAEVQASSSALGKVFKEHSNYQSNDHYQGQIELGELPPKQWIQLPALSTHDQIKSYVSPIDGCEIKHDKASGYHYIRVQEPLASGVLHCIIESSELVTTPHISVSQPLIKDLQTLQFNPSGNLIDDETLRRLKLADKPALIQALIEFCKFPMESADNISGNPIEILNHLIKNRAGACRHRAMLFVAMAKELDLKARYVSNASHAFVTLDEDGVQRSIDLGGAEMQVKEIEMPPIQDSLPPEISSEPPKGILSSGVSPERDAPPPVPTIPFSEDNPFQTWNNLPLQGKDWPTLADELSCSEPPIARRLLIMEDLDAIESLHEAMLDTPKPIFFTEQLDAMSLRTINAHDGIYDIVDSPLAAFLHRAIAHPDQPMTWCINWSNPKAEHVGLNSILDDLNRRLGDIPLPPHLQILVLMDKRSAALMGEDFYSRFDGISQASKLGAESRDKAKKEPVMAIQPGDALIINGEDWKKVLLGGYHINGKAVTFEPGALIRAIDHHDESLRIHNAPWENAEFRWFMTELLKRRSFSMNGHVYSLPDTMSIDCVKPQLNYPNIPSATASAKPSRLTQSLMGVGSLLNFFKETPLREIIVVNSITYAYLFPHHRVSATKGIISCEGLLKQNGVLKLIITDNLSETAWFNLIATAKNNHCDIELQCAPHVNVPEGLKHCVAQTAPIQPQQSIVLAITNDIDFAATEYPKALVIPIGPDTRFEELTCHIHREEAGFRSEETPLLQAIRDKKPIVFKGEFSIELAKRLQTLFTTPPSLYVNGEMIRISSPITLITKDKMPFEGVLHQTINYDPEIDFQKLEEPMQNELRVLYNTLAITPCHAHFMKLPKDKSLQKAWVKTLSQQLCLSAGQLSHPLDETLPEDVLKYLEKHPFVFFLSETGAGKSYFVEHVLRNYGATHHRPISIHHGLEHLKAWAQSGGDAVLFLDEANLIAEHFHLFDNLARGERVIWIEGQSYPLSPHHHVIFAGNPKQYEGRFESDLLKRFPNYMEFKGPRLDRILTPLLQSFESPKHLIRIIEEYYQKALEAGLNITPRNAQMMCLRAFIQKQRPENQHFPDDFLIRIAILKEIEALTTDHALTKELSQSLPGPEKEQVEEAEAVNLPPLNTGNFIMTESRKKTALSIQALLSVREKKMKGEMDQAFGINGMVLEGSPGLGKSRLLIALLDAHQTPYTLISTSNPETCRLQLLEAFDKGQVAIIDELNSFPDEQLLNALLSGTDLNGNPPTKPGFCLLATQNPITYQGRQALSKALSNRLLKLNLAEYEPGELQQILEVKFQLPKEEATQLISAYNASHNYAKQQGLLPAPNPRTLFKAAEAEATQKNKSKPSVN